MERGRGKGGNLLDRYSLSTCLSDSHLPTPYGVSYLKHGAAEMDGGGRWEREGLRLGGWVVEIRVCMGGNRGM